MCVRVSPSLCVCVFAVAQAFFVFTFVQTKCCGEVGVQTKCCGEVGVQTKCCGEGGSSFLAFQFVTSHTSIAIAIFISNIISTPSM